MALWNYCCLGNALDAILLLPANRGMHGGGNGASSTCCFLLQVVRALPMFTFCFSTDVLSSWSARSAVLIFLILRMYTMSFVFQISIKDNGVALLLGALDVITHMVMQVGVFAATFFFPLWVSLF